MLTSTLSPKASSSEVLALSWILILFSHSVCHSGYAEKFSSYGRSLVSLIYLACSLRAGAYNFAHFGRRRGNFNSACDHFIGDGMVVEVGCMRKEVQGGPAMLTEHA
jgi:hypothetical protein